MSLPVLLGAVLTFGSADGNTLQLTVVLTKPATASLAYGDLVIESIEARQHHLFTGLKTPQVKPVDYVLQVGGQKPWQRTIQPIPRPVARTLRSPTRDLNQKPLRVAFYGDCRDGHGPHRALVAQMVNQKPHIVVQTGDVVQAAGDAKGWKAYLETTLPLSATVPTIYSMGNHELWLQEGGPVSTVEEALEEVLTFLPPPLDPLAREMKIGPEIYHVQIGDVVIVNLDSNRSLREQLRFLQKLLKRHPEKQVFVTMHQGPISSVRPEEMGLGEVGRSLIELAKQHGVKAIISGHDHVYERIVEDNLTLLISGGGGAPLYPRHHASKGSQAFVSEYHWGLLEVGPEIRLSVFSLEGVLLDGETIPPTKRYSSVAMGGGRMVVAAMMVLFAALLVVLIRLVRGRS